MVSPNSPTNSQSIIDKFLTGGFQTTDSTNPYLVPVDPYVPPSADPEDPVPDCSVLFPNENRVYDPIQKACVLVEEEAIGDSSDDKSPQEDPNKHY